MKSSYEINSELSDNNNYDNYDYSDHTDSTDKLNNLTEYYTTHTKVKDGRSKVITSSHCVEDETLQTKVENDKGTNKRDAIDFGKHKFNIVKQWVNKCEKPVSKNIFHCTICNKSNEIENNQDISFSKNKESFLILSCHHIFHIKCLAETHFKDIYNYPIIDNEYFENRKCTTCNSSIQLEEIMYLHTKFLSNTKMLIQKHQSSIEDLQFQLDNIKKELRLCYDYKHKLEKDREKSKQIVSILTTII